ncbi:hypothetical protein ABZ172_02720 [Streptomyces sp. NPDC006296]|uniref:hypothetical protein n=1 Tax=Streptomyces sp. NPDC006296 TaxID=3156746 RepID=UPI0033B4013E
MQINGEHQQRGHVLLIAGDSATRRRTVQVLPSKNLAALSMVPVSALLDSGVPSDTTYLDGIHDQNALQVRLRTAAATPGPLLVYLSGRLTTDRRGQQLYLALSRTTTSTARYTALPWEWLGTELRTRPQGFTTVVFDLAADKATWPLLQEYGTLPASTAAEVYGVVTPPGFAGDEGVSTYTRHWIDQLRRAPERPANSRLHALTVAAAALPPGALILPGVREITAPGYGVPSPAPDTRGPAVASVPRPAAPPSGGGAGGRPASGAVVGAPTAAAPAAGPAVRAGTAVAAPAVAASVPAPLPEQPAFGARDPRPHIHALAQSGRHTEAAQMAQMWEQYILQTEGFDSPKATEWVEIRADLAKMSGNFLLATQLWVGAGRTRLVHQSPDAPEVLAAARSAHYCWTQLKDAARARECGPELISLLRALPSLDHRHLRVAQQRLEFLHDTPGGS